MLAFASFAKSAVSVLAWQRLTETQYDLINAFYDGRLWLVIVVVVIVAMLFKSRKKA